MKRSRKSNQLSRRDFFSGTLGTGAVLSLGPLLPARAAGDPSPQTGDDGAIVLHVPSPAGPPPLGAPVETSVPFARGRHHHLENLAVYSPQGKTVIAQFRPAMKWPDGSVRWLAVVFEAAAGPGDYVLREGQPPQAPELVREDGGRVVVDSGEITVTIAKSGGSWLEMLAAPGSTGKLQPIVRGASAGC
jgi:hypothetical protein